MGKKTMSLFGQDKVCQPKDYEGLGFKSLKECNEAFMIKIVWNLLINKEALWAKILRAKYLKETEHIPIPIQRVNTSSM